MKHQQVIENFVQEGRGGQGTYVKASKDLLYSKVPDNYRPYGRYGSVAGQKAPLAVRLKNGDLLANGAALRWPMSGHQTDVIDTLGRTNSRFGVVPFHSIVAA